MQLYSCGSVGIFKEKVLTFESQMVGRGPHIDGGVSE